MLALRPYQERACERIQELIAALSMRILCVLPTGGGKTVIASFLILAWHAQGLRILFVAHRRELIAQAFCKLVRNGIAPEEIGIVMAGVGSSKMKAPPPGELKDRELWEYHGRRRPAARIQIASIDTYRARADRMGDFDRIVIDEAHRSLAKSYRDLVEAQARAVVVGLTATPFRADNKGLDDVYDELVVVAKPRELIDDGFLVEPRVFTVPAGALPDLTGVRTKGGDYDEKQLAAAVDQAVLIGNIVDHWRRHLDGVRTVAFAVSVEHSKHIVERFVAAGVRAEHLDGETPKDERSAILARLDRGETLVVSNCGVLCEGWDQPSVKGCILARPTKSTGLYLQQAGRILRPWEERQAIILDHAGCARMHGLPQDDREFSLDGARKRSSGGAPCKTCEQCYAVVASASRTCPACGAEFPAPAADDTEKKPIEERDGQLEELTLDSLEAKRAAFDAVVAEWHKKNAKRAAPLRPGWCFYRYKDKHGEAPPPGCKAPELEGDAKARRDKLEALTAKNVPTWVALKQIAAAKQQRRSRFDELMGETT